MRIAVYAGTFDPITYGHLSIVEKAASAFDRVIVLIAVHIGKKTLFSQDERVKMIEHEIAHLGNGSVDITDGLVVEYAKKVGAKVMVRGIRNETDADYETRLAQINREMAPKIATTFYQADPDYKEVSSTRLKQMAEKGEDGSSFCSPDVWRQLIEKYSKDAEIFPEEKK